MSGELSSISPVAWALSQGGAVLLVAMSVRMLDDAMDGHAVLSAGMVAYAAACLGLAAALATGTALTLFFACYAIGMVTHPGRRLPSGLTAGAESLLAVLVGTWRFGGSAMLASICTIVFVQAIDDVVDFPSDRQAGALTWATRWGRVEALLFGGAALSLAVALDPFKAIVAPVAAWLVSSCREPLPSEKEER